MISSLLGMRQYRELQVGIADAIGRPGIQPRPDEAESGENHPGQADVGGGEEGVGQEGGRAGAEPERESERPGREGQDHPEEQEPDRRDRQEASEGAAGIQGWKCKFTMAGFRKDHSKSSISQINFVCFFSRRI